MEGTSVTVSEPKTLDSMSNDLKRKEYQIFLKIPDSLESIITRV